jgi:glycerate 2-kinase
VFVVGAGKAVIPMACSLSSFLGDRLTAGVVISKYIDRSNNPALSKRIDVLFGSHPVPDETSINSTLKLLSLIRDCRQGDIVFCLISGGGSALLSAPVNGVTLEGIQSLTRKLLECGAEIGEINTLRKHLDQIKGGGLAREVFPAQLVTLILSDVVGNPLDVIASGPTVADPTTFFDAVEILRKYDLMEKIPDDLKKYLFDGTQGLHPETVKPTDACLDLVQNTLVGSNFLAADQAVRIARQEGYHAMVLTTYLHGEASQVGMLLASVLRQQANSKNPLQLPACIIVGGETTVSIKGSGLGGRNLEEALGTVVDLAGLKNVTFITLATDGEDGPTDAAGAIVTGETLAEAQRNGLNPQEYLRNNDSYHFFERLSALIKTGPTGTNVNDLAFLFVD